jgi:hypothetical protein
MPAPIGPQRPQTTTSTTQTNDEPVIDTPPQQPLTNTQDESALPGWMPNRTRGRAVADPQAPLTSDAVMQAALDRYKLRFESILGQDAMSLARGRTPFGPGDTLSDVQQKDLMRATEDLLKDVPIGKLPPAFQQTIRGAMAERGIQRNLDTTRLGDLGKIGGDIAKSYVNQLKDEKPGVFYGLAGTVAVAAGYAAWEQGSDGLRRMGIKPEVKTTVIDNPNARLRVGVGVDWDPHFTNPEARLMAELNVPGAGMGRPDFRLGADARINRDGALETMTTTASLVGQNYSAAAQATMRGNRLEVLAGSMTYTPSSDFALSAGAMWYEPERRLTAGVEAAWRLSRDVDLAVSASHDSEGDSRVGIGARIRF